MARLAEARSDEKSSYEARSFRPIPGAVWTAAENTTTGDVYLERVAKYIPSEIVAGYVTLLGIVKGVDPSDPARLGAAWALLVLCLLLTPIYLNSMAKPGQPRRLQLIISTIAFLLWAYALGGPFEMVGWYKSWAGSLLLGSFTLISGAFVPKATANA